MANHANFHLPFIHGFIFEMECINMWPIAGVDNPDELEKSGIISWHGIRDADRWNRVVGFIP